MDTVKFVKDKETKRTFRYVAPQDAGPVSGSIYIQKDAFEGDCPDSISIPMDVFLNVKKEVVKKKLKRKV